MSNILGPDGENVNDGITFSSLDDFTEKDLPDFDNPGTLTQKNVAFVLRVVVDLVKAQDEKLTDQDKGELVETLSEKLNVPPGVAEIYLSGYRQGMIRMIESIESIYENTEFETEE
jgi:hypothetical protein